MSDDQIEKVDTSDMRACPCCGQPRAYPTQPGRWEYNTHITFPPDLQGRNGGWEKCTIKACTDEDCDAPAGALLFFPDRDEREIEGYLDRQYDNPVGAERDRLRKEYLASPSWWPQGDCAWRKIQE